LNEKMALGSFRPFQFRLAKWGWAGAALAFDVFPNGFEVEQPMSRMDFGRLQKKLYPEGDIHKSGWAANGSRGLH
jgi:hypothetical protein